MPSSPHLLPTKGRVPQWKSRLQLSISYSHNEPTESASVRMRQFPVHESIKLEFRAEAFNVMNHENLDTTGTSSSHLSLSDPKIGQITGAADPRIPQFALKLFF